MDAKVLQKRDSTYLKLVALLSSVRWKNVLFTVIAQYIAFLFAFNTKENIINSLFEVKVHLIILSTALILAGGYIINNFYDVEKDLINRPHRTRFQNLVSRGFKLKFYFLLNALGLTIALYASWRIFLFFAFYSVLLWFYSHKLSKLVFIRELTASFLTVMAFFSLVFYFKMFTLPFFLYGASLFIFLFSREVYKDIIWLKGDVVHGYESITTKLGSVISGRLYQSILLVSFVIDAAFLFLQNNQEMFVVIGLIALVKLVLIFMINKNVKPIHRLIQLTIFIYIVGLAWL